MSNSFNWDGFLACGHLLVIYKLAFTLESRALGVFDEHGIISTSEKVTLSFKRQLVPFVLRYNDGQSRHTDRLNSGDENKTKKPFLLTLYLKTQ